MIGFKLSCEFFSGNPDCLFSKTQADDRFENVFFLQKQNNDWNLFCKIYKYEYLCMFNNRPPVYRVLGWDFNLLFTLKISFIDLSSFYPVTIELIRSDLNYNYNMISIN